jgi:hypothetical protein
LLDEHLVDDSQLKHLKRTNGPSRGYPFIQIEADHPYKETVLDVVKRLQSERVAITSHDVLAAIQATIDLTREVAV